MTINDYLLGIDIGTTGVKCILIDENGKQIKSVYVEHDCILPGPGLVEMDMWQNWWLNPAAGVRKLLDDQTIDARRIRAIGVSGLYPALGPTDADGNPIANAILYSDNRSFKEVYEVNEKQGLQLSCEELTPRLIWFLRNQPELSRKMAMFFDAPHYLVYKLTGAYVQDTQITGLWGAIYESPTASWREDVCAKFGIPVNILPKVYPPATIVGTVTKAAAELTGLAEGTPVVTGMADLSASLIAAGVVHEYETVAYYGTAGLMPVMKDSMLNGMLKPYPISEKGVTAQDGYIYDYPAYCLSVGEAVRWFRNQFGQAELAREVEAGGMSAYDQLNELAAGVPIGSDGLILLPYFEGQRSPWFDPHAKGVFFGVATSHTRAHFYRAILESFGYVIRHGLEEFYPQGHPLKRVVASGGGARSKLWRQIVSDITGLHQEYVPDAEGAVGCAYVAGIALGWYKDFEPLRKDWVVVEDVTEPNPNAQAAYEKYYRLFNEMHDYLKPIFQANHKILVQDK
jgi:xylulokinase